MFTAWVQNTDPNVLMWLFFVIVFIIVELVTVGLASIWFAAGAVCALLVAAFTGGSLFVQIMVFLVVSIALLLATRPFARNIINSRTQKTNVEELVGKEIVITQRVDNLERTGTAIVRGQEWTVRAENDDSVIEEGMKARILEISGVKLIVRPIT